MRLPRWMLLSPVLIGLAACGSQPAAVASGPTALPSAKSILSKIDSSGLKDAHFTLTEQLPDGAGGTMQGMGDGLLVLKPTPAERQSVQISALGVSVTLESIAIGRTVFHRKSTDANWTASPGDSSLTYLDRAHDATIVGQEMTPRGKAWHLSGTDLKYYPFEIWIRVADGYPLKYRSRRTDGPSTITAVFDRFNTGQTITEPPPSQVVQD